MITLMQNNGDQSQAAKEFSRDVYFDGLTNWTSECFDFYEAVATIETDDLEESFEIHNKSRAFGLDDDRIKTIKEHYSMSVGDIVRDSNGNHHMVCRLGFEKIHQDISRTQREIFDEVKAAAPTMPEDFDWEIAAMNSEANALDADDKLACFKATLEVYVDQRVHEF